MTLVREVSIVKISVEERSAIAIQDIKGINSALGESGTEKPGF